MRRLLPSLVLGVVACGGGGGDQPSEVDAAVDAPPPPPDADPGTLASTGLCADAGCAQIAEGVRSYTPRWALWSDGADKRRWIWLPPGTTIDTTDMNAWVFPVGTKLWKEFKRDGVVVETRLFSKIAADEWFRVAYVWNAEHTEAREAPLGAIDAVGTPHDVPSRRDCGQCHDRDPTSDRVLGFSALQLDYDAPAGQLDLADAVAAGLLSKPPTKGDAKAAFFPLPIEGSAERTKTVQDALGYLHANCGHCHNAHSEIFVDGKAKIQLRLDTNHLARFSDTLAYTTLVGADGKGVKALASVPYEPPDPGGKRRTLLVAPGASKDSVVVARVSREPATIVMPPLATELKDQTAINVIKAWVDGLPPP